MGFPHDFYENEMVKTFVYGGLCTRSSRIDPFPRSVCFAAPYPSVVSVVYLSRTTEARNRKRE
jgi:hypothetical protein